MKMDQGLAWMLAVLLATLGGSGFYWWATHTAKSENKQLLTEGESKPQEATPAPTGEPHQEEGKINARMPAAWSYQGSAGPRFWNRLDKDYLECGSVRGQSPVDLDNTRIDSKLKPIVFHYRNTNLSTTLTGQDLIATVSDGNHVEIEGDRYNLHSISIHTPSEHQIQSVPYEMEIQLNHRSATGDLAVIAVFVAAGSRNEDIELLMASLPRGDSDQRELAGFDLSRLIPRKRTYFHYTGSLTRPPCTGNVKWYVFTSAIEAATSDIEKAVRLVINNARPLQKSAGRKITRSNR